MTKKSPTSMPEEAVAGVEPDPGSPSGQPAWRGGAPLEIPQEHPEDAPAGWVDVQESLAESLNLSVLLVDGRQPPALALSNNNSICHAFQSSPEYVGLCDPYCGDAHRRAISAGSMLHYKCHAGLQCFTMPVQIGSKKDLAAIGGRAFVSVADYRSLVDRFRAGELNDLLNRQPFDNVIFAESQRLEQLSQRLYKAARKFDEPLESPKSKVQSPVRTGSVPGPPDGQPGWDGISDRDSGEVQRPTSKVQRQGTTPSVTERVTSTNAETASQSASSPDLQGEIDRLRGELEYRTHLAQSLQSFLERISSTDPDKTYNLILTHSRELLEAERASLWVFDEGSNEIILRAAAGFTAAQTEIGRLRIGEGISGSVLESGQPLIVENLVIAGLTPAPAERNYKTKSFISYPITMGGRKIGVLNVTDKSGGRTFDAVDLGLLDVIGPQIAVALERAEWQERATQFQLMSITDPLTGLLNRRYLEERLTEELNRSKRYSYPMSCLMIDIDDFKSYNDRNGHQAGDVALKITAHSLKAALRSADIACRYGGEEFCILLPQTSLSEAGVIAERMRQKVAETDYPYGKAQPRGTVSISIGISTFGKHIDTAESVIAAADRALYNAKRLGKNRIEFYVDNLTGARHEMKRRQDEMRQIIGRVTREEFVGRAAELEQLVSHAARSDGARGLLILLAPLAGVSELLRQTYDELFRRQGEVVPIYYALPQTETTAVSAAIEFLNTFLLQYIAYRRAEPSLCHASLTLDDLVQLAPAADLPWIEELVEAYNRQRFGDDDRELVRFCLTVPQRVRENDARPFVLFDAVQLASYADSHVPLAAELVRALRFVDAPFALAGLRRGILDAVERAGGNTDSLDVMRLDSLEAKEARDLVTSAARRQQVAINDETRDLLVQQLDGSPFFITSMLHAAREKHLSLDSYLSCERLYVDEVLGGRLNRYFTSFLERVAPAPETRRALVRLLCESVTSGRGRGTAGSPTGVLDNRTASFEVWRKRLNLESGEVEQVLRRLHIQELVNWDGETVDTEGAPTPWKDYLRSRFRLDALREPRALVVADMMAHALKRAPQTVALHYRRAASLRLRELIGKFNSQRVPKVLFEFARFADVYLGLTAEEIGAGLDAETDLLRLPQIFHTASGVSFSPELRGIGEESSVVAHAFEGATYTDANEIVWLVAKIDSKLEANRKETETWLSLLEALARKSAFVRTQIWLIANEGFSSEALELIREHGAYGSSHQQFEMLSARLSEMEGSIQQEEVDNEIVMIMPMGGDNEVLAAMTAEQLARRLNFRPEAINQIKTAIVEACINASEHSLSPDRKIYQRFRVEDDRLVITIASRGIVPLNVGHVGNVGNIEEVEQILEDESGDAAEQRRGWGLKLIKTLMDEVEFERVDEGTSLRMTKYLRS